MMIQSSSIKNTPPAKATTAARLNLEKRFFSGLKSGKGRSSCDRKQTHDKATEENKNKTGLKRTPNLLRQYVSSSNSKVNNKPTRTLTGQDWLKKEFFM